MIVHALSFSLIAAAIDGMVVNTGFCLPNPISYCLIFIANKIHFDIFVCTLRITMFCNNVFDHKHIIYTSALSGALFLLVSCKNVNSKESPKSTVKADTVVVIKKRPLDSLTLTELWELYLTNPCYLPLLKDSNLWEKGMRVGFDLKDLYNDSLPSNHPYRNRYMVGDFNAILDNGSNKKIEEIYPKLSSLQEFAKMPKDILAKMEKVKPGSPEYDALIKEINEKLGDIGKVYVNFLNKIWKYKMIPIKREFSIDNNNVYAAGHSIVLCEVCEDTLIMQGRFAVSPKRQDIALKVGADGVSRQSYYEYFPTGKRKKYYAGLNRIYSKNWDTQRSYDSLDIARDMEVGGGNNRITFYKGKVELSNFLLMVPSKEYPNAMHGNGIHEVALRELARGMLGTANSIGCLRVSDFGSKFLRWWVPQNSKLFIAYNDTLYHKKINIKDSISNYLPFKTKEEGDSFRKWLNINKPEEAKILEISETGDYRNGYIIDGYYYFKDEYENHLKSYLKTKSK